MRAFLAYALAAALIATSAAAEGLADAGARAAALNRAEVALAEANTGLERRRALGQAVRAYQAAMHALRQDIDAVSSRIRAQERTLGEAEARLRRLTSALARLGRAAEPMVLTGAGSPGDAARTLVALDHVAGATLRKADALRTRRAALTALRVEQTSLLRDLEDGRDRLAQIRDRLIAQARSAEVETGETPDLSEDAANLAALAIALDQTLPAAVPAPAEEPALRLSPPVQGAVLRGFGDADPAGIPRPGLTVEAMPGALISSPASASVRYIGRLDGYGTVLILEPTEAVLIVLAGLDSFLVRAGEVVEAQAPLGFLPGLPSHEEFSGVRGSASGQPAMKTLYMEIRQNQAPVDPMAWIDWGAALDQ